MSKKNRSGCLIIATLGIVGVAIVYSVPEGAPERTPVEVTQPADVPQKPGVQYIIIKSGDKLPADIKPPLEVHVAGVTEAECQKMGGTFQAASGNRTSICLDVDY